MRDSIHKGTMPFLLVLLISFAALSTAQVTFDDSQEDKQYGSLDDMLDKLNGNPPNEKTSYPSLTSRNPLIKNAIPYQSIYKENSIHNGLNNFALNINKVILNEKGPGQNIVLSPLSIAGVLSLLLLGSVGRTYDEIASTLGFFHDISESRSVHQEFASLIDKVTSDLYLGSVKYGSALFLKKDLPIRPQYEEFVRSVYRSLIAHVDFQNGAEAQRFINKWVYDATNGKIPSILTSPPPQATELILGSVLNFAAEWEKQFPADFTVRAPFTLDKRFKDKKIDVMLMGNEGHFPHYESKEHECVLVGLPYKGNKTVFYAIKPLDATKKDIKEIINDLTAETLDELIRSTTRQSTIVTLPRMKLSANYEIKSVLEDMGIHSVFSSSQANLALLSPPTYSTSAAMKKKPIIDQLQNDEADDSFIFARIGAEDSESEDCSKVFKDDSLPSTNCTTTQVVDGKNVTVVYKKIGDKIGKRVVERSADFTSANKHERSRRQSSYELMNPGLYVDRVIHKVDIDVSETGTEASAATLAFITKGGYRPVFSGTEPFFFFIRDEETKFILFSAIVYRPEPNFA